MILADANFENLARGEMHWEGDHLRIALTVNDSIDIRAERDWKRLT